MTSLLQRIAGGIAAMTLAGCAQIGGGLQQLGTTVAGMGQKQNVPATVPAGVPSGPVTDAVNGIARSGPVAPTPPASKPADAVRSACDTPAFVVDRLHPTTPTPGYTGAVVMDKSGTPTALKFIPPVDRGGIDNLTKLFTGQSLNPGRYHACIQEITGVAVPQSCSAAFILVTPRVLHGFTTTPMGYDLKRLALKKGGDTLLLEPQERSGLNRGNSKAITACYADLKKM